MTKALHWSIAIALLAQFVVGYAMDAGSSGRGRGRGRSGESGRGRGRGGDYDVLGDDALLTVHVVLGLVIITLAVVRLVWRATTPLPPWAETLSPFERTLAHWTERALYALLFLVPGSGLALVVAGDDLVALHVAAHVALYVAFALHIGLVLKHQVVDRDRLVGRMT